MSTKFAAVLAGLAGAAQAQLRMPESDECIIYEHAGYAGASRLFKGDNTYDMGNFGFNDVASSWQCGSGVVAYLCADYTTSPEDALRRRNCGS